MAACGGAAFGQKKNPVGAGFLEALEFCLATGLGSHSSAGADASERPADTACSDTGRTR